MTASPALEVGLGRVMTASPVRGRPRASRDGISCPELASGESKQRLPPRADLDESEQCLPSKAGLG